MKTLLITILGFAVLAGPIRAEDQDQPKQPKNRRQPAPQQPQVKTAPPRPVTPRTVTPRVQNNFSANTQLQQRNNPAVTKRNYVPKSYTPDVQARLLRNTPKFTPPDQDAPRPAPTFKTDNSVANNNWQARTRNRTDANVIPPQPPTTTTTAPSANTTARNRDWRNRNNNNNSNWQNNNNRNWQNNNTSGTFTYDQARRRHHRQRHHRSWWTSRYNRIALFGGGYYYWDNNYWYPAYGYDPYYSTYTYDEPIYGYNDLQPGQVIANVQTALQEQGYYRDAVDGLIGPRTRAALSNFQRDHGLPITAAIDGPTLQALGLY